jgi:polar amino acid transport system substrate-binding protein
MAAAARRQLIQMLLGLSVIALLTFAGVTVWRSHQPPTRAEAFPDGVMHVGLDASFAPFAVYGDDGFSGLDIDLARALADEMGVDVQFVNMGYDGLYDSLRSKRVDVLINALPVNPARTRDVRYTRHYFDNGLLLVTAADSDIDSMREIPGQRIAFEYGSGAHSILNQWERRVLPFTERPYELPDYALDAVRLNEADAALVTTTTYRLYRREHPGWQPATTRITSALYAVAVRYDRPATFAWVDAALGSLQHDGRLADLLDKWL